MPAVFCLLGIDAGPPLELLLDRFPLELEHALAAGGSCDLHVDLRHDPAGGGKHSAGAGAALVLRFPLAAGRGAPGTRAAQILPLDHCRRVPVAGNAPVVARRADAAGGRTSPSLVADAVLPLLYVGAATFMSFGCVAGTTMLCCLVWKRAMDMEVLDEAARITSWLIFGWLAWRLLDILLRGAFGTAFHFDRFAGVFWLEMS
jgi:hypothetical protein